MDDLPPHARRAKGHQKGQWQP